MTIIIHNKAKKTNELTFICHDTKLINEQKNRLKKGFLINHDAQNICKAIS